MERRIGPLRADFTRGEGEKFTTTALLVHGLWSDEKMWRGFAGYLGHRGWSCCAVRLRGRDGSGIADVGEHLADLQAAVAQLPSPPAIIGHDLGGLLALQLSDRASAVVALAPLVPCPLGDLAALRTAGSRWTRWTGRPLAAPRGTRDEPYPRTEVREDASVVRQIADREWPMARSPVPSIVIAGANDRVVDTESSRRLASVAGAEVDFIDGTGHALLTAHGWNDCAARVHRWLIQHLGVSLLALYEESEEGRE
jgi:pimeloyl-ACP methyl ester carboxylesterase